MGVFLPQKQDKEVRSIRIPSNVLKTVDEKASEVDISRNEFINQCILFALQNMADNKE